MKPVLSKTPTLNVIRAWNVAEMRALTKGKMPRHTVVLTDPKAGYDIARAALIESMGCLEFSMNRNRSFYDGLARKGRLAPYFQKAILRPFNKSAHAAELELRALGNTNPDPDLGNDGPVTPDKEAEMQGAIDGPDACDPLY